MQKSMLSLKLKEFRKQNNLTQAELAELLNVSNKSISKWELGKGYPSKKNMIKISETLDVPLEVLMIEEKTENSRLKRSFKYALVSYFIIFPIAFFIKAIREPNPYPDILSKDLYEIIKIVTFTFGHNIYIAIVPSIIIGFVFYFYVIPRQLDDCSK